jgi:hypothetical protein
MLAFTCSSTNGVSMKLIPQHETNIQDGELVLCWSQFVHHKVEIEKLVGLDERVRAKLESIDGTELDGPPLQLSRGV